MEPAWPSAISVDGLTEELARANGFTAAELDLNRTGRIAVSQNRRLWSVALEPVRARFLALLGWFFFLWCVWRFVPLRLFAVCESITGISLWVMFTLITISSVGAFLISLLPAVWVALDLLRDLKEGRADTVEGRVTVSSSEEKVHGMGELYERTEGKFGYAIRDEVFCVSEDACAVLRPYATSSCRAYVTPRSRLLLSVEALQVRSPGRLVK